MVVAASRAGLTVRPEGGCIPASDAELMRVLHDQYGRALWVYVLGLTGGDHGRAEDVVQETLLRAWRKPGVLDQSQGSARTWLFTVAKRIVIDEWRSARHRREILSSALPEVPESDAVEQSVNRVVVGEALKRLSPDHRQVLLECYLRGASVKDAAAALGVPAGTVKSRLHYALKAFKLALEEIGGVM